MGGNVHGGVPSSNDIRLSKCFKNQNWTRTNIVEISGRLICFKIGFDDENIAMLWFAITFIKTVLL